MGLFINCNYQLKNKKAFSSSTKLKSSSWSLRFRPQISPCVYSCRCSPYAQHEGGSERVDEQWMEMHSPRRCSLRKNISGFSRPSEVYLPYFGVTDPKFRNWGGLLIRNAFHNDKITLFGSGSQLLIFLEAYRGSHCIENTVYFGIWILP